MPFTVADLATLEKKRKGRPPINRALQPTPPPSTTETPPVSSSQAEAKKMMMSFNEKETATIPDAADDSTTTTKEELPKLERQNAMHIGKLYQNSSPSERMSENNFGNIADTKKEEKIDDDYDEEQQQSDVKKRKVERDNSSTTTKEKEKIKVTISKTPSVQTSRPTWLPLPPPSQQQHQQMEPPPQNFQQPSNQFSVLPLQEHNLVLFKLCPGCSTETSRLTRVFSSGKEYMTVALCPICVRRNLLLSSILK